MSRDPRRMHYDFHSRTIPMEECSQSQCRAAIRREKREQARQQASALAPEVEIRVPPDTGYVYIDEDHRAVFAPRSLVASTHPVPPGEDDDLVLAPPRGCTDEMTAAAQRVLADAFPERAVLIGEPY